jgi:signal transduction histidine kinase
VVSTAVRAGRVLLEVRDDGRGIAAERLAHLFDLDFSRQGSRVKLSLGLPSSRGVVEAIGGTLRIDSELGRGTAVRIELPLGPAPFAEDAPPASASPSSAGVPESSEAPAAVAISPRVAPTA